MLAAARAAVADILTPPFRAVMLKSVALALGILVAAWLGLQWLAATYVTIAEYPWLETTLTLLAGAGSFVLLAFLVAPVTSLCAGLFVDDIAETVERTRYPGEPPGRAPPLSATLVQALRFAGVVLVANIFALLLLLVPVINIVAFLAVNGYLLGREYFEAVAARSMTPAAASALRRRHAGKVFLAGLVIAAFVAVPILNLAAPLFATAFMVHLLRRGGFGDLVTMPPTPANRASTPMRG